jgi:hypothetical protein
MEAIFDCAIWVVFTFLGVAGFLAGVEDESVGGITAAAIVLGLCILRLLIAFGLKVTF